MGSIPITRSIFGVPGLIKSRLISQAGMLRVLAHIAQTVEHFLGKEEVTGSIPVMSSSYSFKLYLIYRLKSIVCFKYCLLI